MKISVIIPVYNSEKYLHKCIDSILGQTYTNFELLLINDGSTDKSGEICDEYAEKDERVKVFHKENGGVSSARNVGLINTSGDYIIHADSDDLMLPNALQSLYNEALQSSCDIIIGNYIVRYGGKDVPINLGLESISSIEFLTGILMGKYHGALWNKLIRRSCYKDFCFDEEVNYMEDVLMLSHVFIHNPSISFIENNVYVYIQRGSSITNKPSLKSLLSIEKVISSIENNFKDNSSFKLPLKRFKLHYKVMLLRDLNEGDLHVTKYNELNKGILNRKFISFRYRVLLWLEFKGVTFLTKLYKHRLRKNNN